MIAGQEVSTANDTAYEQLSWGNTVPINILQSDPICTHRLSCDIVLLLRKIEVCSCCHSMLKATLISQFCSRGKVMHERRIVKEMFSTVSSAMARGSNLQG
ncbi:hypothetical protein Droror1_Dr00000103 [Drosera rotundifolia]